MPTVTIRDVDEETLTRLRKRAAEEHRSLSAEIRMILQEQASRPTRSERIARVEKIAAMTPKDRPQTDSTRLVREDRDR
ncbi:hypothetical protein SAMN06265365_108151 [Tistlia consotensis]|uniref:Antitoxin FitA-like ribbon-helix-helix domain-containing protein n=1 Tax=Tistlia consotensis USBA 355 TaxID=560819 RepID=A0A1Y6BVW8_9PROT|nr:hypothetical protein [Tistlia consotensis]SMF23626.1 hypothetical protein SAMN05428998_10829 [Tistlia consotensis USBA 355]SNR61431.1 hypothetical protein SAMN06265365_108151 [Tistlia consotensis]